MKLDKIILEITLYLTGIIFICSLLYLTIEKVDKLKSHKTQTTSTFFEETPNEHPPLGVLNNVISTVIWEFLEKKQVDGQNKELVLYSEILTRLTINNPDISTILAWNLAYNISSGIIDYREKYRWINAGINLIRSSALPKTPNKPLLYSKLSWLIQEKLTGTSDPNASKYQRIFAYDMDSILKGINYDIANIANIPYSQETFEKEFLNNQKLKELINLKDITDLKKKIYFKTDTLPPNTKKLIKCWVTRVRLYDNFKLQPAIMLKIEKKFQKLDWRLPATHSLYWCYLGLKVSDNKDYHCLKILTFALQSLFLNGKIILPATNEQSASITIPKLSIVDSTLNAYDQGYEITKNKTFLNGKRNFIKIAIIQFYSFGAIKKATALLNEYRKELNIKNDVTLNNFITKEWLNSSVGLSAREFNSLITGQLVQYCLLKLAKEDELAMQYDKTIEKLYNLNRFLREKHDKNQLPPYKTVKMQLIKQTMRNLKK